MAERENEDGRKLVCQEWGIGWSECRESSRAEVRDNGGECMRQHRKREKEMERECGRAGRAGTVEP